MKDEIRKLLLANVTIPVEKHHRFFKANPGEYAEHDRFLGIIVPTLRKIAETYADLQLKDIQVFIESQFNEERLLALFILIAQYQKSSQKEIIYQFYLDNLGYINNWNLVDASAHLIIGAHLQDKPRDLLLDLVDSNILWERRIAIVATWWFIKQNDLVWTIKLAELLLDDSHDLMHKATGWMLRELGKKDEGLLINFLQKYKARMPRTMLRYAIERFSAERRAELLSEI